MMDNLAQEDGNRQIRHIIAVMSGKGGVGKSTVASLLAVGLWRRGMRVGMLDGDLTGPSIARMFDAQYNFSESESEGIEPLVSRGGIKVMSMSMFLTDEADPTVWHGTMLASAFKQFYTETAWGQLDYLLVDVPSGTADVPMTVLRSLPLDGVVVVSSPQAVATTVVKKTVNMIHQFNRRIVGVIENMAYYIDSQGERCNLFGVSGSADLVALAQAPLLLQLPLDPKLVELCDTGQIEEYRADMLDGLVTSVLRAG